MVEDDDKDAAKDKKLEPLDVLGQGEHYARVNGPTGLRWMAPFVMFAVADFTIAHHYPKFVELRDDHVPYEKFKFLEAGIPETSVQVTVIDYTKCMHPAHHT